MDIEIDLLRILWHELGHFCVDIVDTLEIEYYRIDEFWVAYHPTAISNEKWSGAVKMLPPIKFEDLIENDNKLAYAFISLISGCAFQTLFFEKDLVQKIGFNNCFCMRPNCAGLGDCQAFNMIGINYRKKYGNRKEFTYFVNIDIYDIFIAELSANSEFLDGIRQIALEYKKAIFNSYKEEDNKQEFKYTINNQNLQSLKDEVYNLLISSGFYKQIQNLKELIKSRIEKDKGISK